MPAAKLQISLQDKIKSKFSFLKDPHSFFYYVLILVAVGFGFFVYALITQNFTTPYSGDFSQQAYQLYYNFYDDWWTFFKTGEFPFYDANTFLGADNIAANTYYGLFSPFTFPILFVTRDFIPRMMALISIARLVVGGLLFRVYLKYLGVSERTARLFSIAYAFTGWMAYYLWFNPFYEVMTFFPLILFGIEKVIKERKIWAVCLGFGLLGISNYFFLLTSGVFGVAYAGFRYFQTLKTRSVKENWLVILYGFLGFLFGFGLSMFCVYPAVVASFSINRATTSNYLSVLLGTLKDGDYEQFFKIFFTCWSSNIVNYNNAYEPYYFSYAFPLASYFYPTVSNRFTNIMHYRYFENTGSSIFLYTPNMILLGCSIYRSIKNKKISHFIGMFTIIACLFIPFFYFLCGAFVTPYGRWEIIVPLAALAYIAVNFDHRDEVPFYIVIISGALTLACMVGTFFLAKYVVTNFDYFINHDEMNALVVYEIVLVIVETALFSGLWKKKYLPVVVKSFTIGEIIVVGTLVANIHSLQSIRTSVGGGYNNVPTETSIVADINASDDSFFRLQTTRCYEGNSNLGMLENFNGTGTFHSFYNNEIDMFARYSQILNHDTSWSGLAFLKRTNLDEFLGVKYYVTKDSDTMFNYTDNDGNVEHVVWNPNVPLGYERIDDATINDGYRVFKNKYQINLGTSYDTIFYQNECAGNRYDAFYPYSSATDFIIRNEEAYYQGAIVANSDIYEIMHKNGDAFSYKDAPSTLAVNAKQVPMISGGVYANKDGKYFDPKDPDRDINSSGSIGAIADKTNKLKYQIVFEPSSDTYFPLGEQGSYYMLKYPVRQSSGINYAATIYLIGEDEEGNNKVITFDNYQNSSTSAGRAWRGLYANEKVKRIIVCVDGDEYWATTDLVKLYYEPFEDCIARYQNAIDNGLNNVNYHVNTFTFDTNYENQRFVITQLAYTGGWKVYATDKDNVTTELKVYKAQGGFAGFVAPSGEMSYKLCYSSPRFNVGLIITLISAVGAVSLSAVGIWVKKKKDNIK